MRFSRLLVAALAAILMPALTYAADYSSTDPIRKLPVQDAGRVKPFDTFARETLQMIYGKQTFEHPTGGKREAIEVVMTWMLAAPLKLWDDQKFVQVNHKGLKESLQLAATEKYFSPNELMGNSRLPLVLQELGSFRQTKQKLTPYFQAAQRLESQLGMYQAIKQGVALRVAPPTPEEQKAADEQAAANPGRVEPQKWLTVNELQGELQEKFAKLAGAFARSLPGKDGTVPAAPEGSDTTTLKAAVDEFMAAAQARNPELYPTMKDIDLEVHLNTFHPFMFTWIMYLIAAILFGVAWHMKTALPYRLGWVAASLALCLHIYGFILRIYLTGRPPVSNMYESVIWVSFGTIAFAMVFEAMYKRRFIMLAGSAVGVLCLIVADMAPTILDRSLQPLEPVLRSNMWLTVHVLTITLSYSAFFLAWGLGNIGLGMVLKGESTTGDKLRSLVLSIYRSMQVGVVLLAAGTILGGVWADYSWGRFWGWDPKETWALIALLGYLAVLHGRLVGWVQNFGMLAWSIIAFNLVIMAWYGVNYVLGAGLHSYGFGAGGVQYVGGLVLLNLVFVGYTAYVYTNKRKNPAPTAKAA